ncbi:MAG: EAL domain-containing protein [Chloroflexi bacterium]|nr:EAL domain-containing protein [Chloroflexota bacterium]
MAKPLDMPADDALRRLREDLVVAEARLRAVAANAPIVLFSLDASGVFTLSEGKGLGPLGLRPGEVVGLSAYEVYRDNPEIITSIRRALAGETFTSVAHVGGLVYETCYVPLHDDADRITGVIGVATDVTEVSRSEHALAETGRMLHVLIEASPVPITALDVEGRVQLWNPAAERAFGWSEEEVLGQPYPLVPEGKSEEFLHLLQEVVGNRRTLAGVELKRQRKDGSPIDIALSAAPLAGDGDTVAGAMAVLVDITEAKRSEQTLRASEAKYRAIFENIHDVFYQTELRGTIVEVSPSASQFGYSREQLIGTSVLNIYSDADERIAFVKALSERGEVSDYEIRLKRGDGGVMAASVSAQARRDAAGAVIGFEGTIRDISERKRFESQLVQMANHDPLTGLFNRRRFDEELERHVSEAQRYGLRGALLFMDLDTFKDVNDSRGHHAGDELLFALARLLREQLRATDIVARLGGDEFAVLLPHTDTEQAQTVAADLLDTIRNRTFVAGGSPLRITASIGMAVFPDHEVSAGECLSRADLAMYRAKDEGRDRVCLFTPDGDWQAQIESRISWQQRVREALENDRFVLHAQPILNLADGRISQHELLLRLDGGGGDFVLPGMFLDVAERSGLIQDIDRWVVRQAIRLIAEHQAAGDDIRLEVNLSGKAFADHELLPMIQRELEASGVDPARLILEVTETAAIASIDEAQQFLRTLRAVGCGFALDDFGVGFSSFSHLKHLPVDYLKIDGSFIRDLPRSPVDQHLVQAIVGVARGLGKRTIAEFVGDGETLRLLREYGVDFAQGYFIGRPMPLGSIADARRRAA